MGPTPNLQWLATACKQYGPGRLPRANRRDVGAGYAGAAAALAIALTFALGMVVLYQLGVSHDLIHPFWGMSALVSLPFVVPTAFLVGTAVWRYLPARIPYFGAVAGVVTTVLTYVISLVLVFFALLAIVATSSGTGIETTAELLEVAAGLTLLIGIFATVMTTWLTIPIGCLSGVIYERARVVPTR
ncbi:hypothetical protein [Natrarchaeobius chitinivorans]|uniref:Uncharacterized protein n=1 Tax=Natrarchaeobius chitinivorans TaxID=1679083 RepID=A0A3N6M2N8_NATCH|nr:hypothetical protein [Natrarchaeobius chitinivorans]RQG97683.1 hypothetical protein EA473_00210 [Natrarchaeobius chitinivorans]